MVYHGKRVSLHMSSTIHLRSCTIKIIRLFSAQLRFFFGFTCVRFYASYHAAATSTLIRLRICVFTQLKCLKKQLKFIGLRNKKQLKSSIRKGKNTGAYRHISLLGGEKSTRRLVPGSIKIRETAENQYWFSENGRPAQTRTKEGEFRQSNEQNHRLFESSDVLPIGNNQAAYRQLCQTWSFRCHVYNK